MASAELYSDAAMLANGGSELVAAGKHEVLRLTRDGRSDCGR